MTTRRYTNEVVAEFQLEFYEKHIVTVKRITPKESGRLIEWSIRHETENGANGEEGFSGITSNDHLENKIWAMVGNLEPLLTRKSKTHPPITKQRVANLVRKFNLKGGLI